MLAAGLELAVTFARSFRYSDEEIAYLKRVKPYEDAFYDELRQTRFTGEMLGIPEGEIAFAPEPLLRATAPFREALLLEAGLLHVTSLSTLLATKAARIVHAGAGQVDRRIRFPARAGAVHRRSLRLTSPAAAAPRSCRPPRPSPSRPAARSRTR